jgi:rhamnosyl/mannosyltransferase
VVPYGISIEKFNLTPATVKRAGDLRTGPPIILFIGRLVYYKGLEYLIQAMSGLEAQLWIIGTGPLEAELKQQTEQLHLQGKVKFLGNVPDEDIPAYYHACDIFALPSTANSEMFGIVQLEAAACRKPVVSTSLPTGISWVNQHDVTGLLVSPGDVNALNAALKKLLNNRSLREDMGEAGRTRVEAEFTASRMAAEILEVYRGISN